MARLAVKQSDKGLRHESFRSQPREWYDQKNRILCYPRDSFETVSNWELAMVSQNK